VTRVYFFCGGTPLSLEHVFPQWLTAVLPAQVAWRGQDTAVHYIDGLGGTTTPESREIREQFNAATVRRVCRRCNHGWMNELEGAVRPILTPLIRTDPPTGRGTDIRGSTGNRRERK
jgi:hypothetical protein